MAAAKKNDTLFCENCNADLLNSEEGGLLVQVEHIDTNAIDDVYVCCDSQCYDELKELRVGSKEVDNWKDLAELKNPILFLQFVMDLTDSIYNGRKIEEKAYEALKNVIFKTAQHALRDVTDEEMNAAYLYNMNKLR